ncbi:tRNA (adenine(22)-N(1))-methyltransferase TrmK [Aliikangiella sp. IMCC44653]
MKIGKRLLAIERLIPKSYTSIIDCCCDHGLLGIRLLQRNEPCQIIFNDRLQPILDNLKLRLLAEPLANQNQWEIWSGDASLIKIPATGKHLVVIAGVGGDKTIALIRAIFNNNLDSHFDLIICPVHHLYDVRKFLTQLPLGLVKEMIVEENKRFYEIIYLSASATKAVSLTGSEQWDFSEESHPRYLKQLINHYQRQSLDPKKVVTEKLAAYRRLQQLN